MKKQILIAAVLLSANFANAQSLKDAITLSENEQFDKATEAFKTLMTLQPTKGDNYFFAGENYLLIENQEAAKSVFVKGTQMDPQNALNFVGLGHVLWMENHLIGSKSNFEKAILMTNKKSAQVYLRIAEAYISSPKKDLSAAMTYLIQAEKLEPKNPEIQLFIGDAYYEQGEGAKAIIAYKKAAELDKTSPKAILREGQLYGHAKNYPLAFSLYEEANKINPNFAPAYREEAELQLRAKQFEKAKANYKKYMELCGHNIRAQIRYAFALFLAEDYAGALEQVAEIQKADTTNNILNRVAAYSYCEKQDFNNGLMHIEKFFARAESEKTKVLASDYEYHGKLLYKLNKDSLAIPKYLKAIELDSSRTDLYSEIANAYLKKKKNAEAITYFEKKIAGGKGVTVNDYNGMGKAAYFSKIYDKADTSFATVIKMQPNLTVGYLWRARTNAALDPETSKGLAKPYYEGFLAHVAEKDMEKSKKDILEAYEYLGFYFSKNKDNANAKLAWQKVKELDPTNKKAEKALQGL